MIFKVISPRPLITMNIPKKVPMSGVSSFIDCHVPNPHAAVAGCRPRTIHGARSHRLFAVRQAIVPALGRRLFPAA